MKRFVIRQNIKHCRAMLKMTTDPARRGQIEKLLRDEETKLKKYDKDHKKNDQATSFCLAFRFFQPTQPWSFPLKTRVRSDERRHATRAPVASDRIDWRSNILVEHDLLGKSASFPDHAPGHPRSPPTALQS